MAEQLHKRGMSVTLVDLEKQVLPQLDPELAMLMESELEEKGIELRLGNGIAGFSSTGNDLECELASGESCAADFAILSIGVRPETQLAKAAGIEIGPRGHIIVNDFQCTSVDGIYAAGDAVETADRVIGGSTAVPLGGPANRQGRVAADHLIMGEKARPYPGSIGTAIVRVFGVAAGLTGLTEKRLARMGKAYGITVVNDNHHAGYYPGAKMLSMKVLWEPGTLKILGAQVTGFEGVDKRLDVMATAIAGGMTMEDLCHLELSYAPPFGSAKDIVNLCGFAAINENDGLVSVVHDLPEDADVQLLDVRPKPLFDIYHPEGAINIPFPTLRNRLDELDRSRPVTTICALGKMSYFAARILQQAGFEVSSYSGGIKGSIDPRTMTKPPVN
jgi:rhodanese-related sulfurtransferase